MSETKPIKINSTIKRKKHKVKIALYSLFTVLIVTLSLVFIFKGTSKDEDDGSGTIHRVAISDSSYYEYFLKNNTDSNSSTGSKYDLSNNQSINTDKFAVVVGVTPPPSQNNTGILSDYTLDFPSYVEDSNGVKYFVKEIDTTKEIDPANNQLVPITSYYTVGNFQINSFIKMTDPSNTNALEQTFYQHIKEINVPDSVEYIEVGSFAGLGYVESMTLPFVGSQRGNFYDPNNGLMGKDGYKSAFLSVFGYGPYLNGVDLSTSGSYFPSFDYKVSYYGGNGVNSGELIDPSSQSSGSGTPGLTTTTSTTTTNTSNTSLNISSVTSGGSFMAKASNVMWSNYLIWYSTDNNTDLTMLYCPYYLKNVTITDEISIASRAFIDMSLLETLDISFCEDTNITNKYTSALTIGSYAFFRNYSLKSASLPSNATGLSEGLYSSCHSLTTVTLPITLGIEGKIPENCFADCISLEQIILPRDVKTIGKKAFLNCQSLTYIGVYSPTSTYAVQTNNFITLPQSVETIENQAFRNCTSITSFIVPENVKYIGELAFNGCSSLKDITLPFIGQARGTSNAEDGTGLFGYIFGYYGYVGDKVTLTGSYYAGLYQVEQNGLGHDPNVNGNYTSYSKSYFIPSSLTSVVITSETKVAPGAFMNCANIKNITIMSSAEMGTVDSDMTIAEGALFGCSALVELNIPFVGYEDSVENGTFGHIFGQIDWSNNAQNVTLKVARHLADNTYWYIPAGLKTVEINHQTTIRTKAFYKMHMIENLTIDDATMWIERSIFNGNTNLTNLSLPFVGQRRGAIYRDYGYYIEHGTTETSYGQIATFVGWYTEYYRVRNSLIWLFDPIGNYQEDITGFYENFSITTNWNYRSFTGRIPYALKSITITNDKYISSYAFRGFSSVESITIEDNAYKVNGTENGLIYIESTCMYNCQNLINLTVPFIGCQYNSASKNSGHGYTMGWFFGSSGYTNSIKTRQGSTDYYIPKSLSRIYISGAETYVNQYAFQNMTNVTSIAFKGIINELGKYAFYNCKNLSTLNWAYEDTSYGQGDAIVATFTNIPDYCFYGCVSLGEMLRFIPGNVEKIGNHSFDSTNVSYIPSYLHQTITSIGDYAFNNCQQILEFDFNELTNLLSVGDGVLANCTQLNTVILTNFLTNWMFMNDSSLQNINLSTYYSKAGAKDVIPTGLFYGCSSLGDAVSTVSSPKPIGFEFDNVNIVEIGAYAFADCVSFTKFILPESLTKINSGAFQGCTRLEKMTINRNCLNLVMGTDKDGNDLIDRKNGTSFKTDCGIFYGCNDDFYLEVYYASGKGPWAAGTWERNWNCYYPIYVIGTDTSTIFRYEYCDDLKGYLIIGFNTDDYTFVKTNQGTGYKEYLLEDTLIFPDDYNGMPVKGILEGAFDGYGDDYLAKVNTFVLGSEYEELGADVLKTTNRTIYIYSQMTAAQAQKYNKATTASGNFKPEYIGGNISPNINVIDHYYGTSYGNESKYASRAMIFYKDAWKWSGTTPKILLSAIHFDLEFESYTYDLGNQIVPKIVDITLNSNTIHYSSENVKGIIENNNEDIILKEFYNHDGISAYDKLEIIGLQNILITYSNNVNVGTATINFQSKLNNIYGKTTQYFSITQYELMLFNEANKSDLVSSKFSNDFVYTYGEVFEYYYDGYYDYTDTAYVDSHGNDQNMVTRMTYHNAVWYNDQWTQGSQVLNLPDGYRMNGRLETTSKDVGHYESDKVNGNGNYTGSGFTWKGNVYIYDTNGKNVASNFKLIITLYVEITPYEIDSSNIRWDGTYNNVTERYEYKYNGYVLEPKPYVYDSTWGILDAEFVVSVVITYSPSGNQGANAIDPGDLGSMQITGCSPNFIMPLGTIIEYFEIVNGEITIKIWDTRYKLDEDNNYFYYDGSNGGLNSWTNDNDFHMSITGISDISDIFGSFITVQKDYTYLDKGTYTSNIDPQTAVTGDKYFWWDMSNLINGYPYQILSTERYANGIDDTNGYLDETTKYNITLDLACEIQYSNFDYNLSITEYPTYVDNSGLLQVDKYVVRDIDDSANVITKNFSYSDITKVDPLYILYGIDGYEHILDAVIYNIKNLGAVTININKGSQVNNQFIFKEITDAGPTGLVELTLVIKRPNYETVNKTIQLQLKQGLFNYTTLDKEYDREQTNVYNAFLNMPADFYTGYTQTYTWYKYSGGSWVKINGETTILGSTIGSGTYGQFGPVDIGKYKVHIQIVNPNSATYTAYFEDCDKEIEFTITPRSLIIDVSQTPYGKDNKEYDGLPWSYNPVSETSSAFTTVNKNNTLTVVNYGLSLNLLSGDALTGNFYSYSAYPSTYTAENGDFYSYGAWYISNTTYGDQTSNYILVFKGEFTITQLEFEYQIGADNDFQGGDYQNKTYSYVYNGAYHYATVKVTKPTYNYTIYYSTENHYNGKNEDVEWSLYPFYYSDPSDGGSAYKTYIMIVSKDNIYKTVYDCVTIEITSGQITLHVNQKDFTYDEFEHSIDVSTTPSWATIYYKEVGANYNTSNLDPEDLSGFSTVPPSHTAIGTYHILVLCIARNYVTYHEIVEMNIIDDGNTNLFNLSLVAYNGNYDREYHGFTLSNLVEAFETLTIKVAVDDGKKNWFDFNINETGTNTGIYQADLYQSAGEYPILVLIKKPGYKPRFENLVVVIKPLKLEISATGYNDVYDGNYHTAILKLNSGSNDILYLNGQPISYWTQDEIYEFILNDDLNYSYQTVINNVDHYVDLTVEYGIIPSNGSNQIVYTTAIRKYINVNSTPVMLYYRVSGQDFETYGDITTNGTQYVDIVITKNPNIGYECLNEHYVNNKNNLTSDYIEIQYLARPLTYDDLEIYTKHDGIKTIVWRDRYKNNTTTEPGLIISAPQDLGDYIVTITWSDTSNCAKMETQYAQREYYVRIVERVLTVTYDYEYEYTGKEIIPVVNIDTGTSDKVQYSLQSYDIGKNPVNNWYIYPNSVYPYEYYFSLIDDTQNPNYILPADCQGFLPYKIINRTVYVDYDGEIEYTSHLITLSQVYDGAYPSNVIDDLTVSNLLAEQTLEFNIETLSSMRGTYTLTSRYTYNSGLGTWELHPSTPIASDYFTVHLVNVYNTQNHVTNEYYEVLFNIKLKVVNPPLEIEYTTPEIITFDGYYHTPTITIKSEFPGVVNWQFWEGDDPTLPTDPDYISTSFPSYRNAGVYTINFIVSATNYEPVQGQLVLIIKKANLNVQLNPYTAVYDANKHQTTWVQLNNPQINLLPVEEPQIYYFPKEEVDALGYDIDDVYDFFYDNCKDFNSPLYQFYQEACQRIIMANSQDDYMIDAGDYYAILYAADEDGMQTNITQVVQINYCTIQKRTVWFDTTFANAGSSPFIQVFTYDGRKKPTNGCLFVGNGIFDSSYNSANGYNQAVDAGLISGHYFKDPALTGYTFTTSSADARGNADNENNGDPYEYEGDFEFLKFYILSTSDDVTKNYQPAFIPDNNNVYPVQITIKKAYITDFNVFDGEVVYNGKDILPNYKLNYLGDGIGDFETLYIPCADDSYTWNSGNYPVPISGCQDVGYYYVLMRIKEGKNYHEWQGTGNNEANEVFYNGVWWRVARVHCVPYQVTVNWEETDIDYDGQYHSAIPYIIDVYGNRINLHYTLYDTNRDIVIDQYNQPNRDGQMLNAGRYFVVADCDDYPTDPDGLNPITKPDNYTLFYHTVEFTINKRVIYLYYNESSTWLKTNWTHVFTEDDEDNVVGFKEAFPDYELDLTITTISAYYGTFYDSDQFKIEAIVYDNTNYPTSRPGYTFDIDNKTGHYKTFYYSSGPNVFNNCFYVADNFEFVICDGNFLVNVIENGISYTAYDTETEFDNQYHYPNINVKAQAGDKYLIQYKWGEWNDNTNDFKDPQAFDDLTWTTTRPEFINVGVYKVVFRIVLVEGVENTIEGELFIRINQAEAYLSIRNLDKVYDASPYNKANINISGGFNGGFLSNGGIVDRYSQLVYTFYDEGSNTPLSSAPTNVGSYEVEITSNADNNTQYYQNYTALTSINNRFKFEITPVTLTFNIQADLTINEANNIQYDSKDPQSNDLYRHITLNTLQQSDQYYMTVNGHSIDVTNTVEVIGLQGSDIFRYRIASNVANLGIGTYSYSNAVSTNYGAYDYDTPQVDEWYFYNNNQFYIDWSTYYLDSQNNNAIVHNNKNYLIKLVFTLKAHYPEIPVANLPTVVYADYTGNPISFNSAFAAQETLNNTGKSKIQDYISDTVLAGLSDLSYSILSSNNPSDYVNSDVSYKNVGTYEIYFMLSCQNKTHNNNVLNYDNYLGTIKFVIKQLDRTAESAWIFDETVLDKVYDANSYDSSSWSLFTATTDFSQAQFSSDAALPTPWTITYYVAKERHAGQGDWYASGNELESVVDAGDYMYKLVIPENGVYAETTLIYHFKISRRIYHVSYNSGSVYSTTYNTLTWQYDLIYNFAQHTSAFSVQRQNQVQDEGLLDSNIHGTIDHQLKKALMISSSSVTGLYHQNQQDGDAGYINFSPNYHMIEDTNGDDVTSNYEFIFDYALEIEKGDVTVGTTIANGEDLQYGDTLFYYFEAWLVIPTGYAKGSHIEYSTDYTPNGTNNGTWSSDAPKSYHDCGTYTVYVRVKDVQYYNDIGTDPQSGNIPLAYTFTIKKLKNTITIDDPSREYNGLEISPQIHTLDYNGAAHSASSHYNSNNYGNVVITYHYDNNGSIGATYSGRPKEAGVYWVRITIPDNDNYEGVQGELKFEIYRRYLTVKDFSTSYTYNATNITPTYRVVTQDNNLLFSSNNYSVEYFDSSTSLGSQPPMNYGQNYKMVITPNDTNNYQFDIGDSNGSSNGPFNTYTLYYKIDKCTIYVNGVKTINATAVPTTAYIYRADLTVNGLPSNCSFDSDVATNFLVTTSSLGTYTAKGSGTSTQFLSNFTWNPGGNEPSINKNNVAENISLNYIIEVDITLIISSDILSFSIQQWDAPYDGQPHTITFNYYGVDYGALNTDLFIMFSDKGTENINDYQSTEPQYTDYTNGMIKLDIAIKSKVYTGNQWLFLHYDPNHNTYAQLANLYVNIDKANTKIDNMVFDLNKVYDGQPIINPTRANGDFTIFTYEQDNLDLCVEYTYEIWDSGTSSWISYSVNTGPTDAGKYRLQMTINCSKAVNQQLCPKCINYNDYTTNWYEFEISPRKLVINIPNDVKKYDGYVWQGFLDSTYSNGSLTNATFNKYNGDTNSGLVSGHTFAGYIETYTYLLGQYVGGHSVGLQVGDFVWHNQYEFKDAQNNIIPYSNYDIYVEASIKIEKNVLDITFAGYGTHPYTGNPYYLTHTWNTLPYIQGQTNYDDYIKYCYDNAGFNAPSNLWSITQQPTLIGQTSVFVRIDIYGYEVFEQQYIIEVVTLHSTVDPSDWGLLGNVNDIVYNGIYYDNNQLKIKLQLSDQNDTRTPYLKFYYKNLNGDYVCFTDNDPLSSTYNQHYPYDESGYNLYPLNAGEYAVTFCVDAANGYSAYESPLKEFKILQRTVTVDWLADYWDGAWPQMYYTGSQTHPLGEAYGVIADGGTKTGFEEINLTFTAVSGYNLISKGVQCVEASITQGYLPGNANSGLIYANNHWQWHAEYYDNYILDSSKVCSYEIINGVPGPIPGGGPVPPGGVVLESIKFEEIQYDPKANAANTAYEWSAALTVYFKCTYTYSDSSTIIYYYEIDPIEPQDVGPMNLTVNNIWDDQWTLVQANPILMFDLELQAQVTIPEFEVQAKLKDTQNYAWNSNGDTQPQVIWVQLEPYVIDDYPNQIQLVNPNKNSILLQYQNQTAIQTFYDQNDPDQKTYVIIKSGYHGITTDITLEIHQAQATSTDPFEILYGRHAKASGNNAYELAYYIVRSNPTYPIQFKFGDYDLYKTYVDAHPTNSGADAYDLANYTNVDSSFVPAFTFTIKSPEPTYIQLTANSKVNFVHYDQDLSTGDLTYTFGVSNVDRYNNAGTTAADRKASGYKLSHIDQNTYVNTLLDGNFINNLSFLVVWDGKGNKVFDGSVSITSKDLNNPLGTGSYVELYDDTNHTTLLDAVEIVVVGDLDGDGLIGASDIGAANNFVINYDKNAYQAQNSTITQADVTNCLYLAGLLPQGNNGYAFAQSAYLGILNGLVNGDSIETNFYDYMTGHNNAIH